MMSVRQHWRHIAVVILAAAQSTGVYAQTLQSGRNPALWPFSSDSPWNTPIGSGAQYASDDDPTTYDLTFGRGLIRAGHWSHPIYQASASDAMRTITDLENHRTFHDRVPADARPDPEADAHMYVVSPDSCTSLEMYQAHVQSDGNIVAKRAFQVALTGLGFHLRDGSVFPGVRAMDASGMGGIIRAEEIRMFNIPHALTLTLAYSALKHMKGKPAGWGGRWPSDRDDFDGIDRYTGHVFVGSLVAIRQNVDITKLGLTPAGLALARALQDYGAYADDSTGSARKVIISAEGKAEGVPELDQMRGDFDKKLRPLLRVVLNNTPETPGGGGAPRRPPTPPIAPQYLCNKTS